jgi:hypothetical protein
LAASTPDNQPELIALVTTPRTRRVLGGWPH